MLIEMSLCYFAFSIKTSKCIGSCNNINHPYAKICVPDAVKNLNVKVFNLMSKTNETRHGTKRVNMSANLGLMFLIINNAGIMINVGANETVEEVELAKITLSKNENKYKCNSCTLYVVLFSILFPINVGIGTYFIYFN